MFKHHSSEGAFLSLHGDLPLAKEGSLDLMAITVIGRCPEKGKKVAGRGSGQDGRNPWPVPPTLSADNAL